MKAKIFVNNVLSLRKGEKLTVRSNMGKVIVIRETDDSYCLLVSTAGCDFVLTSFFTTIRESGYNDYGVVLCRRQFDTTTHMTLRTETFRDLNIDAW